ncbi:hypothetical protein AB0D40_38880 [Streptomyces massasporeus]|uniref:hypothetical protein n=1 Tax=Streptomyces massasporeus TaxID=67324 RepID=UPI0033DE630A
MTALNIQSAGWHRPSDVVTGAAVSLLWCYLASVLVPGAADDMAATRASYPWALSLAAIVATAAALWWASGEQREPDPTAWSRGRTTPVALRGARPPCRRALV